MAAGDIETFRRGGIWFNRIQGETGVIGSGYDDRAAAVVAGRGSAAARQVAHTVREEEGPSDDVEPWERNPRDLIDRRLD